MHLKQKMNYKVIIIGASSDLAQNVSSALSHHYEIVNVSRKKIEIKDCKNITIKNYSVKEIQRFVGTLNKNDNYVFIFFNGVADSKILINILDDEIEAIIDTNLLLPIFFTKCILKKFLLRKTKYIYLTSARAQKGGEGLALYSTSKSALKYFAKSLSIEYGKFNQYFYVISLGIFNYGLISKLRIKLIENIKKNSVIKDFVRIEELTNTILFLIENDATVGSVINVDNGWQN
jgi:NAD(P)-dependent dehydrogenase (short-subunit alcohol dehydrogenase family)